MNISKRELEFQNEASETAIEYLKIQDSFSLQSPTGSGKTLITGMIISDFLESESFSNKKNTFIFIAPSVGSLDHQGYEKISGYLKRGWLHGFDTEYIGTGDNKSKSKYLQNVNRFEPNKAYFIGWSLFGSNSNLTNIDSERNNLFRVIQNTKKNDTNIILIIDEAHREVKTNSETKQAALLAINPFKRIEISATLDNPDFTVNLKDVRAEFAIKKSVIVSSGADSSSALETQEEVEQLISSAIEKQTEVKKAYFKKNISNKPLILIQIPDKQKIDSINIDEYYLALVKKLKNIDITYIDPPYNQHPYGSNYFMLNLIIDNIEKTNISKVSGIVSDWNRSKYNKKKEIYNIFNELIKDLKSKYIIVSYNSEGFLLFDEIFEILSKYGEVKTKKINYNTYKASRNLYKRDAHLKEYIFILKKG